MNNKMIRPVYGHLLGLLCPFDDLLFYILLFGLSSDK